VGTDAADALRGYAGATAKIRRDERAEAERAFLFDDFGHVRDREGASVVLWTPAAGRMRCHTLAAFCALQSGASVAEGATPEPITDPLRKPWRYNPHAADPGFMAAVQARAHRDAPVDLRTEETRDAR